MEHFIRLLKALAKLLEERLHYRKLFLWRGLLSYCHALFSHAIVKFEVQDLELNPSLKVLKGVLGVEVRAPVEKVFLNDILRNLLQKQFSVEAAAALRL